MRRNRSLNGRKKDGYTKTTPVDGSSGIAGITWEDEYQMRMPARSNDGMQFVDMSVRYETIAEWGIFTAVLASAKHFFIGRMIHGKYKNVLAAFHNSKNVFISYVKIFNEQRDTTLKSFQLILLFFLIANPTNHPF